MTRLSVVVPVYNVEHYLDECLQSLADQDFLDFEAVCVNDGSTDASRDILARWERAHDWLRVIDKPNGGLSSARNAGMAAAQGKYLCFLDSDDRLTPNACGRIVSAFEKTGAEVLVYGGYTLPRDAASLWLERTLSPVPARYDGPCEELLFSPDTRPFAWRTAVSHAFYERVGLRFDEGVAYGEDQVFQFAVYARSHATVVVADRLYEYRVRREDSLMAGVRKDERVMLLEHVRIAEKVLADYVQLGLLDRFATPLLSWLCGFVADDALRLDPNASQEVLGALGQLVLAHWGEEQLQTLDLHASELRLLLACVRGERLGRAGRLALFVPLHRHLYGRISTAKALLGGEHGLA